MPKLYQNRQSEFYTRTHNQSGEIVTLHIDEGVDWLLSSGFDVGDELGSAYYDLVAEGWLFTKGEEVGGGLTDLPYNWVPHEALALRAFCRKAAW